MTPNAQRIAIAQVLGYSHVRIVKGVEGSPDIGIGHHPSEPHSVPDYLNDLNAMHAAEWYLHSEAFEVYVGKLRKMFLSRDSAHRASAAPRAEAFLRTLDLWTDL